MVELFCGGVEDHNVLEAGDDEVPATFGEGDVVDSILPAQIKYFDGLHRVEVIEPLGQPKYLEHALLVAQTNEVPVRVGVHRNNFILQHHRIYKTQLRGVLELVKPNKLVLAN